MIRKQAFGTFLQEHNIPTNDPWGIIEKLDQRGAQIPDVPNAAKLGMRLMEAAARSAPTDISFSPKNIIGSVTTFYRNLNLQERMTALRFLSSGARVAQINTDSAVISLLNTAYAKYLKNAKSPLPKPKLIVLDSDFAIASIQRGSDNNPTLYLSSTLLNLLDEQQTAAIIAQRLGQMEHDLQGPAIQRRVIRPIVDTVTRNITKRERMHRADSFAARLLDSPESLAGAFQTLHSHNAEMRDAIQDAFNQVVGVSGDTFVPAYAHRFIRRTGKWVSGQIDKLGQLEEFTTPPKQGALHHLITAPAHPSIAERVHRARQDNGTSAIDSRLP